MQERDRPLTHEWIWNAIDALARRNGLSPSGLARLAGLDPTAFNPSKRFTGDGRPRWPSTESIAKVLEATDTSLDAFAAIQLEEGIAAAPDAAGNARGAFERIPIVGEVHDAAVIGWEPERAVASGRNAGPRHAPRQYALAVADGSLEPVYSRGNTLIVSEATRPRAGDRVVVKRAGLLALPRLLVRATPEAITLGRFGATGEPDVVPRHEVSWIARIVLVRQ